MVEICHKILARKYIMLLRREKNENQNVKPATALVCLCNKKKIHIKMDLT